MEEVKAFFKKNDFKDWVDTEEPKLDDLQSKYQLAATAHTAKKTECDAKQITAVSNAASYTTAREDACDAYCYDKKSSKFDEVRTTLLTAVQKRKDMHVAMLKIL